MLQCTVVVIVGAATSQTDMAVPKGCCQAVVCTAALISEGCTLAGSVLLLVIVVFCEQHTVTSTLAVTQACCRAVVCTAALISEGCTLAGSVLQCTVAGRCGGSNFSNRHGSATSLLSGCCLYMHFGRSVLSSLSLVIVPLCEQHTFTSTLAVTQACCRAVVCTAALISEGCTLAGSVLQCTVAGHCGFL